MMDYIKAEEALSKLRWARFRLTYQAETEVRLPPFKGSTLRGPFGHAFHRMVCTRTEYPACVKCPLRGLCPYALVFEPSPPENSKIMQRFEDVPRPFVFECSDERTLLQPGELFSFDFLVFGKAVQFFPYFVLVFRDTGMEGIGKGRGKIKLLSVECLEKEASFKVYSSEDNLVRTGWKQCEGSELLKTDHSQSLNSSLTMDFQTMTRLTHRGRYVDVPEFHILVRNLARRLSTLLYFYHYTELAVDYPALFAQAENVRLVANQTTWQEWVRYSRRQQEKMLMGGLVGKATYQAETKDGFRMFLPFLLLGQITHVGKGTVFGLGKYEVKIYQGQ